MTANIRAFGGIIFVLAMMFAFQFALTELPCDCRLCDGLRQFFRLEGICR